MGAPILSCLPQHQEDNLCSYPVNTQIKMHGQPKMVMQLVIHTTNANPNIAFWTCVADQMGEETEVF